MMNLLIIIPFILAQYASCDSLIFVQELFRHGARGPISNYWDYKEQEDNKGELVAAGIRQHYMLGQQVRKEYIEEIGLLKSHFDTKEIYVRSTDINRTIMSAQAQLNGLYPNTGLSLPKGLDAKYTLPPYKAIMHHDDELLNNDYALPNKNMVFPVHVVDRDNDIELQPWQNCPNHMKSVNTFLQENEKVRERFNDRHRHLYRHLSEVLNVKIDDFSQIGGVNGGVYDAFISDLYQHRRLPQEITQEHLAEITYIDSFSAFFGDFGSDYVVKQLATPFFKELLKRLDRKINREIDGNSSDEQLKLVMYSGHDSNIILAMRLLNISSYQCLDDMWQYNSTNALNCYYRPAFASSLIWELYQKQDNQHYIQVKYNGQYVYLCENNNTYACDYNQFKHRINNYILQDSLWHAACYDNTNNKKKKNHSFLSKQRNYLQGDNYKAREQNNSGQTLTSTKHFKQTLYSFYLQQPLLLYFIIHLIILI